MANINKLMCSIYVNEFYLMRKMNHCIWINDSNIYPINEYKFNTKFLVYIIATKPLWLFVIKWKISFLLFLIIKSCWDNINVRVSAIRPCKFKESAKTSSVSSLQEEFVSNASRITKRMIKTLITLILRVEKKFNRW